MTITLTKDYTKSPVARAVPGAVFNREDKAWELTHPTPRGAAVALRLFPELSVSHPELLELRASLAQELRPIDNATAYAKPIGAPRLRTIMEQMG